MHLLFLLVDDFVICSRRGGFFACKPSCILCQLCWGLSQNDSATGLQLQSQETSWIFQPSKTSRANIKLKKKILNSQILKKMLIQHCKPWMFNGIRPLKPETWLHADPLRLFLLLSGFQSPLYPCFNLFLGT